MKKGNYRINLVNASQWRSQNFQPGGGGGKARMGGRVGRCVFFIPVLKWHFCTLNVIVGYIGIGYKLCVLAYSPINRGYDPLVPHLATPVIPRKPRPTPIRENCLIVS